MQDIDFNYFLENMGAFYAKYGHKFFAVKNKNILGIYEDFNEALENTLKTEELGTFLIQECFDSEEKMIQHFQSNVTPVLA